MHVEKHQVGVFDQSLHFGAEASNRRSIQDSMISANTEVDCLSRLESRPIPLSKSVGLTESNNRGLGSENRRHEVPTADVTHAGHAERSIREITCRQLIVSRFVNQSLQVLVNFEDRLVLHCLDVGHGQAVS